jgi:MFS family permease
MSAPPNDNTAPPGFHAGDLLGAARPARGGLLFAWLLLFIACLPDAMLPPVLRQLMIDRFGATEPQAHAFMAINLVGAVLALPVLYGLRRAMAPSAMVTLAAILNGVLLTLLAWSPDLATALVLRCLEGAADMAVLAVLLHVASRAGARSGRGRRLGVSATVLMLGLAGGAILGGVVGSSAEPSPPAPGALQSEAPGLGSDRVTVVLLVGAGLCGLLALLTLIGAAAVDRAAHEASTQDATSAALGPRTSEAAAGLEPTGLEPTGQEEEERDGIALPLWIPSLMMGTDRMLAGLLTATIPLLLAARLGWSPERIGGMLAIPLLLMALGAYPAGLLADRLGYTLTRTGAALIYALAIAFLPIAGALSTAAMFATLLILGFAAAALMPTALALAASTRRGAAAMGTVQAAGNIGYLLGIVGAGALLALLGGERPDQTAYAMVIQIFALTHVVASGITLVESRRAALADADQVLS